MIFEVIERSLRQPSQIVPVEALLGNCEGGRMPEVVAARLTPAIARQLADICPTAAIRMKEDEGRPRLSLSYGRCIGCGKCIEAGEGAVVTATRLACCGEARDGLTRTWDLDTRSEIAAQPPAPQ